VPLTYQDAIRFDAFLKENDKMAHEALKAAEREAKAKADKLQEIKRLKHAISIVEGEKLKLAETLEDAEQHRQVGMPVLTQRKCAEVVLAVLL
jgi:hypothetical protein